MDITLRQLRYFEALARHRHFGRAAGASAISQPALSVGIRDLESILGAPLFERRPGDVRLTAFGEVFAPRAREILRGVEELGDLARMARGGLSGRVRLGVIPTVAPYLLPSLIRALSAAYPGLELGIRETVTPRLIEEVSEGRLDAVLVALPISEPSLEEVALLTEPFVLVRPQSEAGRPVPPRERLAGMRLLLLEEGHCFRDQALSFCDAGPRPRAGLDGSSLSTLVQMAGAGLGVTLIPRMAVAIETRSAAVAIDSFPEPQPERTLGLAWRRRTPLAPQLRGMSEVIRRALDAAA